MLTEGEKMKSNSKMNFRGLPAQICGVDLDPRVVDNPMLDEGRVANADGIPYEDNRFDVVFSDYVLEHLEDPLQVFREVVRVLKSGGVFLFKTPNKYHYMPTIARLTPHAFHQYVNRLRGRAEVDTFPTRYRANTRGVRTKDRVSARQRSLMRYVKVELRRFRLRRLWKRAGFRSCWHRRSSFLF